MTTEQIREKLRSDEYSFLKTDPHLGERVILLAAGGSHAYGTDTEGSDLDIRGCALNSKRELLTDVGGFEQFGDKDTDTDTVIYSFNKLIHLLTNCNPNVCEILGCKPEHYFYVSPIGQELLDNTHLFLSKKAINSFGGYANQQLRRLENLSNRVVGQSENEQHILKTIQYASTSFKQDYFPLDSNDSIKLYIDQAVQPDFDTEIFMDVNLYHYPLRDYKSMWAEMQSIVKSYAKIGKRNLQAIEHNKLGKHMCHLIRLYLMCIDILEQEKVVTYREKEHDLLMDIRNNKYLDDNDQPIPEFYEMLNEMEKKLDYAKENTSLPDEPDYEAINEFVESVNERVVRGEI